MNTADISQICACTMERGDVALCKRRREFQHKMSIKNFYPSLSPSYHGKHVCSSSIAMQKTSTLVPKINNKNSSSVLWEKVKDLTFSQLWELNESRISLGKETNPCNTYNSLLAELHPQFYLSSSLYWPFVQREQHFSMVADLDAAHTWPHSPGSPGRQHVIILQQPQLSGPPGHGELTFHAPSLWPPTCHHGRGWKDFEYLISIVIGGKKTPNNKTRQNCNCWLFIRVFCTTVVIKWN